MASPLAILARGYAVVEGPEGVVRDSRQIQIGERITTRLAYGKLVATVTETLE